MNIKYYQVYYKYLSMFETYLVYLDKPPDTVGQPPRAEICVSNMPALKAKKLRKLPQEKVLLEL
jgi:hypothetical protein